MARKRERVTKERVRPAPQARTAVRMRRARMTACQGELVGGPRAITYPGSIKADSEQDAKQAARDWFDAKTEDEILDATVGRNCSGFIWNPCDNLVCDDGRCIFDYEISDVALVQVKAPGKTHHLQRPTPGRWTATLTVWWGCFCQEAV